MSTALLAAELLLDFLTRPTGNFAQARPAMLTQLMLSRRMQLIDADTTCWPLCRPEPKYDVHVPSHSFLTPERSYHDVLRSYSRLYVAADFTNLVLTWTQVRENTLLLHRLQLHIVGSSSVWPYCKGVVLV